MMPLRNSNDRVFISSTVYDLIDIRAELEVLLKEMGFNPILSGSTSSDFRILPDRNSIETCLANVRSSSTMIIILSKRYGPSLKKVSYPDLSATHLEYQEARKESIPIYMYVRDRLEADYCYWRKNDRLATGLWIDNKDVGIFSMLDEHKALVKNAVSSNWYQLFSDSVELKRLIKRDLKLPAFRHLIERSVETNDIAILSSSIEIQNSGMKVMVVCRITNCGTKPAYDVIASWIGEGKKKEFIVLPPNQSAMVQSLLTDMPQVKAGHYEKHLEVKYRTTFGFWIIDKFELKLRVDGGKVASSFGLIDKIYKPGEPLTLKIDLP